MKREIPIGLEVERPRPRAENEYQALMETLPFEEPDTPIVDLLPLKEVIADAWDLLDPREQFVLNSLLIEKRSLRELGRMMSLGKSRVHQIKLEAIVKLQDTLSLDPIVKEKIGW